MRFGHTLKADGARYRDIFIRFPVCKLQDMDVIDTCFQQDGATCRTARSI